MALGEVATDTGSWPADVVAAMHRFSRDNADACKWIRDLRNQVDDLHLVIFDDTHFEIPWELLVLPADAPGGTKSYLGIAVCVSRWPLDVSDIDTFDLIPLEYQSVTHSGHAAAWVDRVGLSSHGPEYETLEKLGARFGATVDELKRLMMAPLDDIALVYVAGHGSYSSDSTRFVIGDDGHRSAGSPEPGGLVLNRLESMGFHLFRHSKVVIFLNVCHAGRPIEDRQLGADRAARAGLPASLRGFPESFLTQGAKGVIATTGEVNDADAAEMAKWLLGRLAEADDVQGESITQLLRNWRAFVRASLPLSSNDWSELDHRRLLTASMYVYYGNPFARLRLAGRREATG